MGLNVTIRIILTTTPAVEQLIEHSITCLDKWGAMTLSIMTLCLVTFSVIGLNVTLRLTSLNLDCHSSGSTIHRAFDCLSWEQGYQDTQHTDAQYKNIQNLGWIVTLIIMNLDVDHQYAECSFFGTMRYVMSNLVMLNVMLGIVILNVTVPIQSHQGWIKILSCLVYPIE